MTIATYDVGLKIGVEGDASFQKKIQLINQRAKELSSEMKAVTSAFNDTDSAEKKLASTSDVLNRQIDNQRNKIELLQNKLAEQKQRLNEIAQAYQKTVEEQGKDSEAAQKLANEYANQAKEVSRTQTELNNATASLNNMEGELRDVTTQLEKSASKTSTFRESMEKLGTKLKEIGDKMTAVGKKMTTYVTAPIVAGFTAASKSASDYEENLNKIQVAFGDQADEVTEWANTAITEFGLSKVAATDAVSAFGALAKGVGLTEKEAAGMSTTLAGLTSDLASYFNTGTDEAATALEGIFTGNAVALKKYGVVLNDVNLKQFAEDQGRVYSEMSQTEKIMLRYNYVLSQTADAQGDYSRTSDGTANSLKTFKAAIQDMAVALGTQLLPIITPIVQKITELAQKFANLPAPVQKAIAIVGIVVAAIGPLLTVIGTVISAAGALGIATSAVAAPLLAIVAIVAAVVAAGIWLAAHWDELKETAKQLADWVSNAWETIKTRTTEIWNNTKETVSNAVNAIKGSVQQNLNAMKSAYEEHGGGLKGAVAAMWAGIKDRYQQGFDLLNRLSGGKLGEIVNAFKTQFNNLVSSALGWGRDIIQNIINGINSRIQAVISSVAGIASRIRSYLHFSEPDVGPLSDFNTWMPDMMKQMAQQIEAGRGMVQRAASDVAGDLASAMYVNGGSGSNSNTYNYGGISINVSAGSQSPSSIADAVMLRIQEATQRKVAVWQ